MEALLNLLLGAKNLPVDFDLLNKLRYCGGLTVMRMMWEQGSAGGWSPALETNLISFDWCASIHHSPTPPLLLLLVSVLDLINEQDPGSTYVIRLSLLIAAPSRPTFTLLKLVTAYEAALCLCSLLGRCFCISLPFVVYFWPPASHRIFQCLLCFLISLCASYHSLFLFYPWPY